MKSTFKLIRRFVLILMLSLIGLVVLNIVLQISFTYNAARNVGGWTEAEELADMLVESESGVFLLADEGKICWNSGRHGRFWLTMGPEMWYGTVITCRRIFRFIIL